MEKLQQILGEEKPILLDFYTDWCSPCQTMDPILDGIQEHFGSLLHIQKINADKLPAIVQKYKVTSVPTYILFVNGEIEWRVAGVQTRTEMIKVIQQFVASPQ
ncbi:MAG TPA: thioredoxin family protein [Brumimicrobium sp.]|nr:thioredoxin family protein [Brumimicrobium sp.]